MSLKVVSQPNMEQIWGKIKTKMATKLEVVEIKGVITSQLAPPSPAAGQVWLISDTKKVRTYTSASASTDADPNGSVLYIVPDDGTTYRYFGPSVGFVRLSQTEVTNGNPTLAWNTESTVGTVAGTRLTVKLPANPNTDTKNTAGGTNKAATKMFLVGAETQGANPVTYSNRNCYVGADNCLYSGGLKVLTAVTGFIPNSAKGAANGVASLDASGLVLTSQLPSYVDDVVEILDQTTSAAVSASTVVHSDGQVYYLTDTKKIRTYTNGISYTDTAPEKGKIYVDLSDSNTYRWGGSALVEISKSLALGNTSSTAFRGDYGKTAYDHAAAKGSAFPSGLYKITTNAQGHVTAAASVVKNDITALGIPGTDTTYAAATTSAAGLMSAADKAKLNGIATGANKYTLPVATASALGGVKNGTNVNIASDGTLSVPTANQTTAGVFAVVHNISSLGSLLEANATQAPTVGTMVHFVNAFRPEPLTNDEINAMCVW